MSKLQIQEKYTVMHDGSRNKLVVNDTCCIF